MIILIDTNAKAVIGSESIEVEHLEAILKDVLKEIAGQREQAKVKADEILRGLNPPQKE